jgi:hypothetical protein
VQVNRQHVVVLGTSKKHHIQLLLVAAVPPGGVGGNVGPHGGTG